MLIGYARVSTGDQTVRSQLDALQSAGVERVFCDEGVSSRVVNRPEWVRCREFLRPGDTLVVWRLDRLAGTALHSIRVAEELAAAGIELRSLTEHIDTTTAAGRLQFNVHAAVNQQRIEVISENTKAGLAAARARGRIGGRPIVRTPELVRSIHALRREGNSIRTIAGGLNVSTATVSRALRYPDEAFKRHQVTTPPRSSKPMTQPSVLDPFASELDRLPGDQREALSIALVDAIAETGTPSAAEVRLLVDHALGVVSDADFYAGVLALARQA